MPGNLDFAKNGAKMEFSAATTLASAFPAEAAAATSLALTPAAIVGAAMFVASIIQFMMDDKQDKALAALVEQIQYLKQAVTVLNARVDEIVEQAVKESTRQTLRDLSDYMRHFEDLTAKLKNHPTDGTMAADIANEASNQLEMFLREDYEIWRWSDLIRSTDGVLHQLPLQFKNTPTLPVYAVGILIWLAARELAVQDGKSNLLVDDNSRLTRHQIATSLRREFKKYTVGNPDAAAQTIAEHISGRIIAEVIASTKYAEDRICKFFFRVSNYMTGDVQNANQFDLLMPAGNNVLCTLNPDDIGSPNLEIEWEDKAGISTLSSLSAVLARLASGGSIRTQYIGQFGSTEVYYPSTFYIIEQDGNLTWYRNEHSSKPGCSTEWQERAAIGSGWNQFSTVFCGGGTKIFALQHDGAMRVYFHNGAYDGSPQWSGPLAAGNALQGFKSIFSAGEDIVYGIRETGELMWSQYLGGQDWAPQRQVGTGWGAFKKVFAGGLGIIYALKQDGELLRYNHLGYLTGDFAWQNFYDRFRISRKPREYESLGDGWNLYRDVIAGTDGVLYGFADDGRIFGYRFVTRKVTGRRFTPVVIIPGDHLEGPVEVKHGRGAYQMVFSQTPARFRPPA